MDNIVVTIAKTVWKRRKTIGEMCMKEMGFRVTVEICSRWWQMKAASVNSFYAAR